MNDDGWMKAVISLVLSIALLGGVLLHTSTEPHPSVEVERQARRQAVGEAWCNANKISATATCRGAVFSTFCDIVPHDARPPFKIECNSGDCRLWTP